MEAKRFYEEIIELYKRFKELCLVAKDNGWYNVEMEKSKVHLQGSFEEIKESRMDNAANGIRVRHAKASRQAAA